MAARVLAEVAARLLDVCLAPPETAEVEAWGDPTFRTGGRFFALTETGDGRGSVWCKAPPGSREVTAGAEPETLFVPPHIGAKDRVGTRLDRDPDRRDLSTLVDRSHPPVAPKRRGSAKRKTGKDTG